MILLYIVFGVLTFLLILFIVVYNRLITLRNRFKNAFSQIDVQLKRRYDLIPNLVETAKAYLTHERNTLEAVIAARNQAMLANQKAAHHPQDPTSMKALMGSEALLSGTLSRLLAVSEAYPDLKANETMAALSEELTSTENKIAFARQAYNDSVMTYNIAQETFPNNVVAVMYRFLPGTLWEMEVKKERQACKVSFS